MVQKRKPDSEEVRASPGESAGLQLRPRPAFRKHVPPCRVERIQAEAGLARMVLLRNKGG